MGDASRCREGDSTLKKWSCIACTYENWPRAVRCAMCQQSKDFNPKGSRNIYELAYVNNDLNMYNKWSCHTCTYMNWPKAIRCTQCQRNRSSSPTSRQSQAQDSRPNSATGPLMARAEAASRPENTTYPLMIPPWARTSDADYGSEIHRGEKGKIVGKKGRTSPSPTQSPTNSPGNSPEIDSYFNRMNLNSINPTSGSSAKASLKWSCTICTFENWPKASKCSMCCTPRNHY